ncbi:UDP-N-acetyl glucosamine 2-epimerase [Maribacter polysiphoniae]|uniref:UDP-GlcNAc3NAcA epimerase n=1 Tax=Maribacter polysiphoniae TaxID=429344 RepID=A0A316E5W6_9FLAO|nr:UDP-N-acetylglucosamine 2-epimerase [Maribacter polysiphoniae]PWK25466.1 UDP-GlcNAc3NAcA epimerase [Maribacter polysiphoniae]
MKIITIDGARPQFVKAADVSRAIFRYNEVNDAKIQEIIEHTGQHFDRNMSEVFFNQMDIPKPHYNLDLKSLSHGTMKGKMLAKTEEVLVAEKPYWVLVYSNTNATTAGGLAAKKIHIKVAHREAGFRSFNMLRPQEVNRILTDHISDTLFCSTQTAIDNLKNEGYSNIEIKQVHCGDVMYDAALFHTKDAAKPKSEIELGDFVLSTIHRQENTDDPDSLASIFDALGGDCNKNHGCTTIASKNN